MSAYPRLHRSDGSIQLLHQHAQKQVVRIEGRPLEELRKEIDEAQSFERRMDEMIIQSDAIELTPDVVAQLLRSGWSSSELADAAREGARYSPSRDSLLFPAVFGE